MTERFASYSLETEYAGLPELVKHAAARCVLDHLGCVVGGMQTKLGRIVSFLVKQEGGAPQATLVASNSERVPVSAAALANGTAANALDFDDTLEGHPGATVIAAALAAAEMTGSDGCSLLTAVVVGYDVCSRLVMFWNPMGGRYQRVWDTATLQTFGAAAAAGHLLGLTVAQMSHGFGIAAVTAPLPRTRGERAEGEIVRPIFKSAWGWAAQAGLRAAQLAILGMTGQPRPFDELQLFWEQRQPKHSSLTDPVDRLGEVFSIERVEFKPYPACRFLHPALDALSELLRTHRISWQVVKEVHVSGAELLGDAYHYIPEPSSQSEAQFSTPFCVAALLYYGHLAPKAFSRSGLDNHEILALARRVKVIVDPEIEEDFPSRNAARVRVAMSDGKIWEKACYQPRGTADNPLDDAALTAKFVDLTTSLFPTRKATRVAKRVLNLESEQKVGDLMKMLS